MGHLIRNHLPRLRAAHEAALRRAVAQALELPVERVRLIPNADKYHERTAPQVDTARTTRVFELMATLNRLGLHDPRVGADASGRGSFRRVLDTTVTTVARHLAGRPLRYVELGPEPVKTCGILAGLLRAGVRVVGYLGVDVNPASPGRMRPWLERLLPRERIQFQLTRYEDLPPLPTDAVNLVTLLGFEEGNEHPDLIDTLLARLLGMGDLVLSEQQVLDGGPAPVLGFYRLAPMREFSRLAYESLAGVGPTTHSVRLVPLDLGPRGVVRAAVTLEQALPRGEVVVTNHCLKLPSRELLATRQHTGCFGVIAQHSTGDATVVFQLAERL